MIKFHSLKTGVLILALIFLVACVLSAKEEFAPEKTILPTTVQATRHSAFAASLLVEWRMGEIRDIAWSPDSKMLAVNYRLENRSEHLIQAFSVESLKSVWIAEDSLAWDLVFTPDGQFIVESNTNVPFFYWRSREGGEVVYEGEFKDLSQVNPGDCNGGGQILVVNTYENTALIADYGNLLGPRTNNVVVISQLDFATGKCEKLFDYRGSFNLFDLNSFGTLLAYGGEGDDKSTIIWDMERQVEVCRIPQVEFGRFVPGENTLAVIRERKIVFLDPLTCKELSELNVSPGSDYENYLAFSPDGKQFAVARDSIQIMNVSTGEMLAQLPFPDKAVPISSKLFLSGIKFSPDGHYLMIAYYLLDSVDNGEIQLWLLQP